MGMYDSLYDDRGHEWQTKAYRCELDRYRIGDKMPRESGGGFYKSPTDSLPDAYQVSVVGGAPGCYEEKWATVLAHVLIQIPVERDPNLLAVDYHGGPAVEGTP